MKETRIVTVIRNYIGFAIVVLLCTAARVAQAEEAENTRYMFVNEVKPGMKGYGLTVFSGVQIERFDVEIVGVLYNVGARSDMILARVAGGPIDKAGVIAGMSGSPIYIDDRIIGALAFSWAFSKEAIAGITPIGEMLRIFDFEKPPGERGLDRNASVSEAWARQANLSLSVPSAFSESVVMRPVMTPMVFSGWSDEAVEFLRPQLEGWGILPVVGGSFSEQLSYIEAPLQEGAAIGIQLVRGDMNAAGIGTVTLKDGDRILAFGHPFMLSGSVDFPMTSAYVNAILPSLVVSSKIGTPLKSVGALTQDRKSGIAGVLAENSEMVPFTLSVRSATSEEAEKLNFEIARNRVLFAPLAGTALNSALSQVASSRGEFSAKIRYRIELDDLPTVHNNDFISGLRGFPPLASMGLFRDLTLLLDNEFAEISIHSVVMDVEVQETVKSAHIIGSRLQKEIFKPGDEIEIQIWLKPYIKESFEQRLSLRVPEHFPEGRAFLYISAATRTAAFERMRAPHRFRPADIASLVRLVDEDYPANRIDIRILVSDPGMIVKGQEMPALPSSVFSVISQAMGREQVGITRASVVVEKSIFMDFEVDGAMVIPIEIEQVIR